MNPRPLRSADAHAAAALIRATFAGQPVDPPPSAARETAETVAAHIVAHSGAGWDDATGLAGVLLWSERPGALYIGRLAVATAARRQGVARRLLAFAEVEARRRGLPCLRLGVRVELTSNHRLFAACGFIEAGRSAHEGYDRPTSIDMEKPLPVRDIHFITHPEVVIDPAVPVPDWPLSPEGMRRMRLALHRPWLSRVRAVFSSAERKAMDAAHLAATHFQLSPIVMTELGENDRSATGYLPKAEFETVADGFFARPHEAVRGWERAVDAQRRIIGAVARVVSRAPAQGDIAIISHGGVGALLLCHLRGEPISRDADQLGGGGGNFFSFDANDLQLRSGWRPIEE